MGTYKETLRNKQAELIRKATDGSVLLASLDAPSIDKSVLFDADGLKALPKTGNPKLPWRDLGWLTDDGAQFSRDVSTSDITSWGSISPTRTDVMTLPAGRVSSDPLTSRSPPIARDCDRARSVRRDCNRSAVKAP